MKISALNGKSHAGNPHIRFDVVEVASKKPMRGSLHYMTLLCVGFAMTLLAPSSSASDRTISAVLDRANNTVNLTFSGVGERMLLNVAHDAVERGETPSAWAEMECLGVISNGETAYTYEIPGKWRQDIGALRFFLSPVATSDKYDRRVEWIQKTTECHANGYVDTGVCTTADLVTRIKWFLPKTADGISEEAIFGVTGENAVFLQSANFFWAFLGKNGYDGACGYSKVGDVPHILQTGKAGIFFDETNLSGPLDVTDRTQPDTLKVFVRSTGNEKGSQWMRIYWLTMTNDQGPVRSMFPCVKDGKTGLYDEVEGEFHAYVAKSQAQLAVGTEWGPDRIADGTAGVVSAGVRVVREVTDVTVEDGSRIVLTVAGNYGKSVVYFARDVEDKGNEPSAWADVRCGGVVHADATTFSYDMPTEWTTDAGVVRAFLAPVVANPKYDMLTEWTYSPNDMSAYIDSGIVPASGIAVRTTFMMPSKTRTGSGNADVGLFGVTTKFAWVSQAGSAFLSYFTTSPGNTAYFSGCGYGTESGADKPHELVLDADGVQLDGNRRMVFRENTFKTEFPTPFQVDPAATTTDTLAIFGRRNEGATTCAKCGAVYIYSFDITTNGVPARLYLPCVKDGKAGLYDRVTDEVFYQYGGSAFEAGPEWGFPTVSDGAVVATSPLAVLTRTAKIVSVDRENNTVSLAFGGISCETLLFAVRDRRGDRGPDVADWAEVFYVGKVAANATEMTCTTLPAKWLRSGGTIRFLLTSAPYDERLDYIASTAAGNQYLDTEVKPTTNTVFAMRITKKVSDHAAWGAVGDNAGPAMSAFAHSSNLGVPWSFFNCSGNYVNKSIFNENEETTYSLRLGMSGLFINDLPEPVAGPFNGKTTFDESDVSIFLFARNNKGDPQKHGYEFKIHGAKIWDGATPVRNFVPCLKGGKAYMYDCVTKRYFDDRNGKGFVAGAPIAPSPDEAPTLSWSEAVEIPFSGMALIIR